MLGRLIVAGVLDDAFAHGEGQIQAAKCGIALFKPGDDAQRVQVVVKAESVGAERRSSAFSPA